MRFIHWLGVRVQVRVTVVQACHTRTVTVVLKFWIAVASLPMIYTSIYQYDLYFRDLSALLNKFHFKDCLPAFWEAIHREYYSTGLLLLSSSHACAPLTFLVLIHRVLSWIFSDSLSNTCYNYFQTLPSTILACWSCHQLGSGLNSLGRFYV